MSQTKFTPQLQDPNYVPSVRGGNEAGQEIEKLGRIGGNFLGSVVEIKDADRQAKIRTEADVIANDLEAQVSENFDIPGKAKDRLNKLGIASQYGTVSETAIILKANAMAKDLKGKFPGYEDIIDAEIDKRVFSGIRGRVLQAAFSELSAAEKASKAAQEDRDNLFKNMLEEGALIHATADSQDVYEFGGQLFDYAASQRQWVAVQAKDVNRQRAQADLTYWSGSHNYSEQVAADGRAKAARDFTQAHVQKLFQQQIPMLTNMVNLAAQGGLTPESLMQAQALITEQQRQAQLGYIQATGRSFSEASQDLEQINQAWSGVTALLTDEKINHASAARIVSKVQSDEIFYAASKKYPLLQTLKVFADLKLPEPLAYEFLSGHIADAEADKSIADALNISTREVIPVGEALNRLGLSAEEKTVKMSSAAKQAKAALQRGLTSTEAKQYFIQNLSVTAAGKATLGSDPEQGKKFLSSFYDGPKGKLVIKTLKEFSNDPSAKEQLDLVSHLAKEALLHTERQIKAEVGSDPLLNAKGDLSKVFSYDEKTGTVTLEARRDKTILVRGSGIVGNLPLENQVLKQSAKELQTSINILNELGETKRVKDFLIQSGLIPDPDEVKETKGSM